MQSSTIGLGVEELAERHPNLVDAQFKLEAAHKDLHLVLELAEQTGVDLPLTKTADGQFERAIELGHGDEDLAATWYGL